MLQEAPLIKKGFVKGLVGLLGAPSEITMQVWHEEETRYGLKFEDSYIPRTIENPDPEDAVRLYSKRLVLSIPVAPGQIYHRELYYFDNCVWKKSAKMPRKMCEPKVLEAKLTRYSLEMEIDPVILKKEHEAIIKLIRRYSASNSISILEHGTRLPKEFRM